ncbi:MAG: TolC family protein [Deltaproteobacteria bacterium]|nr:TolC family protein [Deltaproteobacteria bacterium]
MALVVHVLFSFPSDAATITLEAAIARAQNHPKARAAAVRARAAAFDAKAQRGAYYPEVDVATTASAGFSGSSGGLGITGMNNSPARQYFGAAIELRQNIWDFGRTLGRVRAAVRSTERAEAESFVIRDDLALEVTRRYFEALAADAVVDAAKERIVATTQLYDQSVSLADSGMRPRAEVALAELDRAAARSLLVEAAAEAHAAKARLAALIGADVANPPTPTPRAVLLAAPPSVAALLPKTANRPEIAAARTAIEEARARTAAARAEHLPRLVATGSLGYAHPPDGKDPGFWAVGIGLVWPLFRGFADANRIKAAALRVDEATHHLRDREDDVRLELVLAHQRVRAALDLARVTADELTRAELATAATRATFAAGLLPYGDVARASLAVTAARARLAAARFRYAIARAELARAAGLSPILE